MRLHPDMLRDPDEASDMTRHARFPGHGDRQDASIGFSRHR